MQAKNILLILCSIFSLISLSTVFAAPAGNISFYNTSDNVVSAQVSSSSYGKFTLAANESKTVAYSSLSYVCADNPTNCKANFYVNNVPAGYATIDVVNGKLINKKLAMKVRTVKSQQVLRTVVIK